MKIEELHGVVLKKEPAELIWLTAALDWPLSA